MRLIEILFVYLMKIKVMKKELFESVIKSKFRSIMDGGDWNYDRFGFGELDGKVYRVELEGYEDDRDVYELREGLSIIVMWRR